MWLPVISLLLVSNAVPNQTAAAAQTLSKMSAHAAQLSDAARPQVIAYFDDASFRQQISSLHNLTKMTGEQLRSWFVGNIRKTNVIVTFHMENFNNIIQSGHVFNKWQLMRQGAQYPDFSLTLAEYAETKLMGFPPMANIHAPTQDDADTRPLYFAINIWKKANGNPMYGDTNFVVYPGRKKYLLLVPSDSGWWYKACVVGQATTPPVDCSQYPAAANAVGTFDHFDHLILTHNNFYKYPIADLFKRFYNDSYAKPPADVNYYYEADMACSFFLPEHLWYTILDSLKLWGNNQAKPVQTWHEKYHRPLMWSGEVNHMFVDPTVGMVGGYNITSKDKSDFWSYWTSVAPADWFKLYPLISPGLHLYVLREGDCGNGICGSHCDYLGTNSLRKCLHTGTY